MDLSFIDEYQSELSRVKVIDVDNDTIAENATFRCNLVTNDIEAIAVEKIGEVAIGKCIIGNYRYAPLKCYKGESMVKDICEDLRKSQSDTIYCLRILAENHPSFPHPFDKIIRYTEKGECRSNIAMNGMTAPDDEAEQQNAGQ